MNNVYRIYGITLITLSLAVLGCKVQYSFSGAATDADNITIKEFYNNADLGPANMGQSFTNSLKNYFVQNSSLRVVSDNGQLQLEGEIVQMSIQPIAPVSTGNPMDITPAAMTRLTIAVKVTYTNTLDEKLGFKDRSFSFYKDFPNELNLSDVQDSYVKDIFERIINDIYNASVANW